LSFRRLTLYRTVSRRAPSSFTFSLRGVWVSRFGLCRVHGPFGRPKAFPGIFPSCFGFVLASHPTFCRCDVFFVCSVTLPDLWPLFFVVYTTPSAAPRTPIGGINPRSSRAFCVPRGTGGILLRYFSGVRRFPSARGVGAVAGPP